MTTNYDQIVATLNHVAEQAKSRPLSLGEALASLDHAAFALIAMILALLVFSYSIRLRLLGLPRPSLDYPRHPTA